MTCLASGRSSIRPRLQHALPELAPVGIGVTARTNQILPVIDGGGFWLELGRLLVAVAAWHREVAAGEEEMGLFVPRQRKRRRLVSVEIMAAVAGIEIGSRSKLPGMPIAVAIRTPLKFDLEQRVTPLGDVTLRAFQPGMSSLQAIGSGRVIFHRKRRRLPSADSVTGSTLSAVGPLGKLAVMRIRLVAIHALLENQRFLEITASVALNAVHAGVFLEQGISGLGVIEFLVHLCDRNLLPAAGVVT